MYDILFGPEVDYEMEGLSAFRREEIFDKIDEQLSHEPNRVTRNKKWIEGIKPPWAVKEGFWELRVGEYRVFYDVDEEAGNVIVQAVRRKRAHQTTQEII